LSGKKMTKIILTCGPASESDSVLQLMSRVADGFRLNVAHLIIEKLEQWLDKLQKMRNASLRQPSIILDLQGAKVRIGKINALKALPERITLFWGEASESEDRIPVPCESVFRQTAVGDQLLLNDRKVILRVTAASSDFLEAEVEQNGPLSSGKGLNSPDRVFEIARVTASDRLAIEASQHISGVSYAVSFVADGSEVDLFRPLCGGAALIAKIEQRAAFANLAGIDAVFDEFWLCRGDLGAEAGFQQLGSLQRQFVAAMKQHLQKPALLAGEVLGSMTVLPQPSRAEIVQLDDALDDGFAGIVLSDETACGKQVPAVVRFLADFFNR